MIGLSKRYRVSKRDYRNVIELSKRDRFTDRRNVIELSKRDRFIETL